MKKKSTDVVVLSKQTPHKSALKFRKIKYGDNLIYFKEEWMFWNGSAYVTVEDDTVTADIGAFLIDARVRAAAKADPDGDDTAVVPTEPTPFNPKRADNNEVYAALENLCHTRDDLSPPSWLDGRTTPNPKNIISCKNGLLDIYTGEFIKPSSAFFTRTALPIDYKKDAPSPLEWLKYLKSVTGGGSGNVERDKESAALIQLFQEVAGYLISCDTSQQRVFFLFGPTGSGKGTFLRTMATLIGKENIHNPTIQSLAGQFGMQPLLSKSVAVIGDATCHDKPKLSTTANRVNGISGEDPQGVERKFKGEINTRLPTRFIIAANKVPDFGDHAAAIARRLLFLAFLISFVGKEDRKLEQKLLVETNGILLWALEGLKRLNERGYFVEPPSARKIKTRMLHLANPARGFLIECCKIESKAETDKKVLHSVYKRFCDTMGVHPLSLSAFAEAIYGLSATIDQGRRPPDAVTGKREPTFTGIRLNNSTMFETYQIEMDPFLVENVYDGVECSSAAKLDALGVPVIKTTARGKPILRGSFDDEGL